VFPSVRFPVILSLYDINIHRLPFIGVRAAAHVHVKMWDGSRNVGWEKRAHLYLSQSYMLVTILSEHEQERRQARFMRATPSGLTAYSCMLHALLQAHTLSPIGVAPMGPPAELQRSRSQTL
jgi:hypothetical protein